VKIELVNHSDSQGGAARAAFRLHRALVSTGEESTFRVSTKYSDEWRVVAPRPTIRNRLRKFLSDYVMSLQKSENPTSQSEALFSSPGIVGEINSGDSQVVNLHWVCSNTLSVEAIGRIDKPVVWTMHDMWPFCGAEHYCGDEPGARFELGYDRTGRPQGNSGLDMDRWVWNRKRKAWKNRMHIVAPSRWLGECARRSVLMRDWPIAVIPNPLDVGLYRPYDKSFCRQALNLPEDVQLIAFGALGGGKDHRKGFDLLVSALQLISGINKNIVCVVLGQSEPKQKPDVGMPIIWMGRLSDDISLAMFYSAVDVTVVPSRQENLPQSATEAQACGCPVVAFDCAGLPDTLEHKQTGYLAKAYSVSDLAAGIGWVLEDCERHSALSMASRERAVLLWSLDAVIPQYIKVYQDAIRSKQ
jgi:glycosyltransferase involved in cell wall biosynthesis